MPISFFNGDKGKYIKIIEGLENTVSQNTNLYLFDSLTQLCQNYLCKYSLDGKLLYKDDDHVSNYTAVKIIAPEIIDFLKSNNIYKYN